MRIAQVAPLAESVPPIGYGGTERVVSQLTEALVSAGHDVTLFASGDSVTGARLRPCCPRALRSDPDCLDMVPHHVVMLEKVLQEAAAFDIIHFHIDYLHFPLLRRLRTPSVTTLHGRLDIPDLLPLYREYRELPVVSISNAQRAPLHWVNWVGTVHHGLPLDRYRCSPGTGGYLAFLGRISPEKRPDLAIRIAERAGFEIRLAAKIDKVDRDYHEAVIRPLLKLPHVRFLGEIGEHEKNSFLGGAAATLFPVDWPEPFGLVMIESMACGTPVIAFPRGSVPEIIEHGTSGLLVGSVADAVHAVRDIDRLDRRSVRHAFERRFLDSRMAENYLAIYARLVAAERRKQELPDVRLRSA